MSSSEDFIALAPNRGAIHKDDPSSRPLSEGYEDVGVAGEFAFGEVCGLWPDTSVKPKGDGGIDFTVPLLWTVDVKTARKAYNLIVEQGKVNADIYVLASYDDATKKATLIGWEWGSVIKIAPVRDFGYGILNHYIEATRLKPIESLRRRMLRF